MTDDLGGRSRPASLADAGAVAATLIGATALTQVLTVARTAFVAAQVGISPALDGALVTLVAPTIAANLVINSIAVVLVPAYMDARRAKGRAAASGIAGQTLAAGLLFGGASAMVVLVLAGPIADLAGPGLGPDGHSAAIGAAAFAAPLTVLGVTAALVAAVLQAEGRQRIIGAAWIAGAVAAVVALVATWPSLQVNAYVLSGSVNFGVSAAVMAVAANRLGLLSRVGASRRETWAMFRSALPLAAGTSFSQFNELIDRAVASLLTAGGVSALRYGEQVATAPGRLLAPGTLTAVYPALVDRGSDPDSLVTGAVRSLAVAATLTVPIATGLCAAAPAIVAVLYGRGAFDADAERLTTGVVVGLAPLVTLTLGNTILFAALNAQRRTTLVGISSLVNAVANLVLDLALGRLFGVFGVALGTTLANLLVAATLFVPLMRGQHAQVRRLASVVAKSLVAGSIPAIPIGWWIWTHADGGATLPMLATLMALACAGGIGYLGLARLLGLREPFMVLGPAIRGIARVRRT